MRNNVKIEQKCQKDIKINPKPKNGEKLGNKIMFLWNFFMLIFFMSENCETEKMEQSLRNIPNQQKQK